MTNWTKNEARMLGDFLLAHLEDAKTAARQQVATENRGTAVTPDDAAMFDSYASDTVRERAVKLAVANIQSDLKL